MREAEGLQHEHGRTLNACGDSDDINVTFS